MVSDAVPAFKPAGSSGSRVSLVNSLPLSHFPSVSVQPVCANELSVCRSSHCRLVFFLHPVTFLVPQTLPLSVCQRRICVASVYLLTARVSKETQGIIFCLVHNSGLQCFNIFRLKEVIEDGVIYPIKKKNLVLYRKNEMQCPELKTVLNSFKLSHLSKTFETLALASHLISSLF